MWQKPALLGKYLHCNLYCFFSTVCHDFSGQLSPWPTPELVFFIRVRFPAKTLTKKNLGRFRQNWLLRRLMRVLSSGQHGQKLLTGTWSCQQFWLRFSILSHKSWLNHVADYTRSESWPEILSHAGKLSRKKNTSYSVRVGKVDCVRLVTLLELKLSHSTGAGC